MECSLNYVAFVDGMIEIKEKKKKIKENKNKQMIYEINNVIMILFNMVNNKL